MRPPTLGELLLVGGASVLALVRCGELAHAPPPAPGVSAAADAPCVATAPGPAELADFGTAIIRAYCQNIAACCAMDGGLAFDVERCVRDETWPTQAYSHPAFNVATVQETLGLYPDAGTIVLNDASAQACLSDLAASRCDILTSDYFLALNRDCAGAFEGTLPPGAPCHTYYECAGDSWCPIPPYSADPRCTSLRVLLPDGGYTGQGLWCGNDESNFGCQRHGFSESGLWCDTDHTQTCLPELPLDAGDPYPGACASGLARGGVCVTAIVPWLTPASFVCSYYALDAGAP